MQCYSCYDQTTFQMIGQTAAYNPGELSRRYIEHFQLLGRPSITCDLCDRTVMYVKDGDKWIEQEAERGRYRGLGKDELIETLRFYANGGDDQGERARQALKRYEVKQLRNEFNKWDQRWTTKAILKKFTEEQSHLKQANRYAREKPDLHGYIIFPMSSTGGWHFYRIGNGKAAKTTVYRMFLEVKKGILDWWNYE